MAKKILPLVVAMVVLFTLVSMAGAANITKPSVDIYYAYPSWGGTPYQAFPNGTNGSLTMVVNGDTIIMPYTIMYVDGYLNDNWTNPSVAFSNAASNNFSGYEWVVVDMVNMYLNPFATGYYNVSQRGDGLITIRTADYYGNNYMPLYFDILQNETFTKTNSTSYNATTDKDFVEAFFAIYEQFGDFGTATDAQTQDMIELLVMRTNGYI